MLMFVLLLAIAAVCCGAFIVRHPAAATSGRDVVAAVASAARLVGLRAAGAIPRGANVSSGTLPFAVASREILHQVTATVQRAAYSDEIILADQVFVVHLSPEDWGPIQQQFDALVRDVEAGVERFCNANKLPGLDFRLSHVQRDETVRPGTVDVLGRPEHKARVVKLKEQSDAAQRRREQGVNRIGGRARLERTSGPGAALLPLGPGAWSIGRLPEHGDRQLLVPVVSRHHATIEIEVAVATAMLTDEGSCNGTWVAGKRLEPHVPVELQDGASVSFGCGPSAATYVFRSGSLALAPTAHVASRGHQEA